MKIEKNKVVTISCELRENDKTGPVIDTYPKDDPLKFLTGASNIIEDFENNIMGMSTGDSFDFILQPSQSFGDYDEENIMNIPYDTIVEAGKSQEVQLEVGHPIRVADENGNEMIGEVTKIDLVENNVIVDFNHPFAGISVHFAGEIMDVREATDSEVDHGHAH